MRIIFTLFLLIICTQANAQSISGWVYSEEQETVPFAAVTLNQVQDSTLVKADITNEKRYFEIKNVPSGTFNLNITNIGFADYQKQVQ